MSRKKITSYQEHVLADYENRWESCRNLLITILTGPSPLCSAHLQDTLRHSLELYLLIAAHREAVRVARGEMR